MIARVVEVAEQNRGVTIAITLALAAMASIAAFNLDLDALPDITTNQVLVLSRAPGFTPEEVEQRVTRPIEASLFGIPGLVTQRSISRYGIAAVTAVFGDDVDPYRARQLVGERLTTVRDSLPEGVEPPELGPYTGGLGEVFQFTLRSETHSSRELLELVQYRIGPIFRMIEGVVEVNPWGGAERTLDVVADPVRMAALGVGLSELRDVVGRASESRPGDAVASGSGRTLLRAVSWPRTAAELGAVVVSAAGEGGRPIRIADVATVREGKLPRLGAATRDGGGEVVYVMVQMVRGGNALRLSNAIEERMDEVRAALPPDVTLDVVYDRSDLVEATLRTVGKSLAEGGLFVTIVLLVLLGSLRGGLIVATTIPLSMIFAMAGMTFLGIPGNLMSLGAIDFGLVVDGGVVMVEGIFHRAAESKDPSRRREEAREAMAALARPVFFSMSIIALVYIPVLTLQGVDGKMFRPMAATVVLALIAALLLSLTYIPALASLGLTSAKLSHAEPWIVRKASAIHGRVLDRAIAHPFVIIAIALLAFVGSAYAASRSGVEFIPQLDEGDLVVQTTRQADMRLETAVESAGVFERAIIEKVPEVIAVASRIGSPAVATDIMGIEQADVMIRVLPRERWREGLTREQLIDEIDAAAEEVDPYAQRDFTQPIQMRFNELLGGTVSDVGVTIYGEGLEELRRLAEKSAAIIDGVRGAEDVRISSPPSVSLVEMRPHELHAAHVGLEPADVVEAVSALRYGLPLGETYDGIVRIPIRLLLDGVNSVYDLSRATIPLSGGVRIPLAAVAEIRDMRAPGAVEHTDGQRRITVGFNVRERDLGGVVAEVRSGLDKEVPLPRGYRRVFGGQYANMEEAYARLAVVVPIVLACVLLLLALMFRSIGTALLVFSHVPFAIIGGMFALALRQMPISVPALIGFIALAGVAVLNGVVLVSRMRALEEEGMEPKEAISRATRERLRPVLMTAGVAALGFVPMMLASGVGAEVQRPLATVVVGGLVTSTLLTLVVLPTVRTYAVSRSRA